MAITKYEIYNYWKDKYILDSFRVETDVSCEEKAEAVRVIEFSDDICCWACGLPSLTWDMALIDAIGDY
ncbi:hypothetical protein [Extibacter muris]|uniref:hypothetical protein n=1 Tax=Extibacter muris TaxID=1796622 RepID=UPI001D077927|nr:hypothetical protein [Extibacter muris]MCB6203381.1 hypothetical protein [Extibacter muris]MCQ4664617.1 hypothetical protein [Extibacter muris]MCQ4693900.1 hypothetical protein [Extibacter muris]